MRNAYVSFDLDPLDLHALGVSGFHLGRVGRLFGPPWSTFFVSDFIRARCNAFRWSRFRCLDPLSSCAQPRHGVRRTLSVDVPSRGRLRHPCGSLDGLVRFVDLSSSFGWSYDALGVSYWLS
ncbi:hypothetical protein OG21DRAFT_1512924 [Imleria badia]|nr:hypothetical protein OG21DRAFT_1512924 [Imleria badia]